MRHRRKPNHGKATHGTKAQNKNIRGQARQRRSAQCKSTRNKVNRRKAAGIYCRYIENNAIQCKGKKQDVETYQNKTNERQKGIWHIPWQKVFSILSLLLTFCGFNCIWHIIHCYLQHHRTAAISDRKEHIKMNQHRKQVHHQIAVGGLCVNRLSLLAILSFLLVLVQILLMLCGDVEPNPGPTTLTINELDQVVKVLEPVQDKWFELGHALLVPRHTLNDLFQHCSPDNCLREMLHAWMQSKYSTLSWETLRDAVAAIGERDLSQFINHQYVVVSSFSQQRGMVLSLSQCSPHSLKFLSLFVSYAPYFTLLLCSPPSSLLQTTLVTVLSLPLSAKSMCLNR